MSEHILFDRQLIAKRRMAALTKAQDGADFLMKAAAADLQDRLDFISRQFDCGVDLGGHTGHIYETLKASGKVNKLLRADIFAADPNLPKPDLVLDDAVLPFAPESLDLIVCALNLQMLDDLPGALIQIKRALKPDGLFLGLLLGTDTLAELRDCLMRAEMEVSGGVSPRVIPFADTRDLGGLLQRAEFALPVTDIDRLTVRYDTMFDLIKDLRAMGATNPLNDRLKAPTSKKVFLRAAEIYAQDYADADGRIRATFTFASLSGWAPHESQQKPLKPGSAKHSLAEALGTKEIKS
ncbi:Methyltransferase domain protein [Pseudovibrio axinellae]|uniref:Methyltransferase domain protein n=1 Tax=Pseudovibrio axinellae TaxID=989403 RepID=A0A165WIA9_9HYPH|nr:methyltransferase domain-containing protein [Pseudovibrio axinellae]KZL16555.1 Methyltransferase domain protein [Pseudovibrio axinellae]SEQ15989.1 Methyltransferase domain-containing protein [Pseudovibrio axinellae]